VSTLISHVDLRVRDRAKAAEFYDALLSVLGGVRSVGETFTTWSIVPPDAPDEYEATEWFGITEDARMTAGPGRVAFDAPSRGAVDAIATILPAIGARNVEWSEGMYGPEYYAVFFEDPDGNRLEIVHVGA